MCKAKTPAPARPPMPEKPRAALQIGGVDSTSAVGTQALRTDLGFDPGRSALEAPPADTGVRDFAYEEKFAAWQAENAAIDASEAARTAQRKRGKRRKILGAVSGNAAIDLAGNRDITRAM